MNVLMYIVLLLGFIMWVNHMLSCAWVAIGKVPSGDARNLSWLETPLSQNTEETYRDSSREYQYLTALHWSFTQMTPGSMQVFPLNSIERVFNVACLFFGLIVFTSLVSSLSAKLTQLKLLQTEQTQQMQKMMKFLRDKAVESKLVVRIRKQTQERMAKVRPSTMDDVQLFNLLSVSLRIELKVALTDCHIKRHPFLRLAEMVDVSLKRDLCYKCTHSQVLLPRDSLFLASHATNEAYRVSSGTVSYRVDLKRKSFSRDSLTQDVSVGTWLSEAALWVHWSHRGNAEAMMTSEVLSVRGDSLCQLFGRHLAFKHLATDYAITFHVRLKAAIEQATAQDPGADDLHVPHTELHDMVVSMARETQIFLGSMALEQSRSTQTGRWQRNTAHLQKLEDELREGECLLLANMDGEIERITDTTVVRIETSDGLLLVQLGEVEDDSVVPVCRLPSSSQFLKAPGATATTLVEEFLFPYAEHLELTYSHQNILQEEFAAETRIRSKQTETVYNGVLHTSTDHRPGALKAECTVQASNLALSETSDVFAVSCDLQDRRGVILYAWLEADCFERLIVQVRTAAGEREFRQWLSGVRIEKHPFSGVLPA